MLEKDNFKMRKYIKIGMESGCVSANYNMNGANEEVTIVPYENSELSGSFIITKEEHH